MQGAPPDRSPHAVVRDTGALATPCNAVATVRYQHSCLSIHNILYIKQLYYHHEHPAASPVATVSMHAPIWLRGLSVTDYKELQDLAPGSRQSIFFLLLLSIR